MEDGDEDDADDAVAVAVAAAEDGARPDSCPPSPSQDSSFDARRSCCLHSD